MTMSRLEINIGKRIPLCTGGSSKGCQNKYCIAGYWYKQDSVGYESLAEVLASRAAAITNAITPIVSYDLITLCRSSRIKFPGCRSKSFLHEDDTEITLRRLAEKTMHHRMEKDSINLAVSILNSVNDQRLLDQLSCLFQLDRITINSDRHLNNIVLRNLKDIISFDYGDSLAADVTYEFTEDLSAEECIVKAVAKPSFRTHDYQCEFMKSYSNFKLEAVSSCLQISDLVDSTDESILKRMCSILSIQFEKYLNTKLIFI